MLHIIRSVERKSFDHGWLQTKHSFSFGSYQDRTRQHFGSLRVFNDDVIQPGEGFGTHPHQNFEIMTYMISGALEHEDSLGNKEVLRAGEVQRMTAGSGVSHSEYNHSQEEEAHLLQIWFYPDQQGLPPSWEQKGFSIDKQKGKLIPIVSGKKVEGALSIHQDVTVYVGKLEANQQLLFTQEQGRKVHLFVIEGELEVDGQIVQTGDTAEVTEQSNLTMSIRKDTHLMLIDLA
ncbi:redox-sensitive bicupin YhaK (pirin superfamily) [Croceifilum oryzae]|uniref:Redox-sensitive bicupin YhaK (Pirin superfamily) n=1 Tax=Croceifilum oryzae TaxID=1553429 RepID=A0AAJ1TKU9_9BACL|nr:pirin family protein [Croceifilum oryzae]MDQ0416475.1 redox-sensitive bicupin YhaK (pirin superfamily) [Croceifilum oryzae]